MTSITLARLPTVVEAPINAMYANYESLFGKEG